MRTYRDYCRPASPIERTAHMAKPGDVIFTGAGIVRVDAPQKVVAMRRKAGAR